MAVPSLRSSVVVGCLLLNACLLLGIYLAGFSRFTLDSKCSRRTGVDLRNQLRGGMRASGSGTDSQGNAAGRDVAIGSRYSIDPYQLLGPVKWQDLAQKMRDDFTRNGSILSATWFFEDGVKEKVWIKGMIDQLVFYADAGEAYVPGNNSLSSYGPKINQMFFDALKAYPVMGKSVLVVGSEKPWVEALCISHAAASITVVDYNPPRIEDARIKAISMRELDESDELYDTIFCYNTIMSDGLGRYGDPINPWADLQHMRKLRGLLQPGGKMLFGVHLGNDTVQFNGHRIYGKILFPQLVRGWKVETMFGGTTPEQFYNLAPLKYAHPLFILSVEEGKG